MRLHVPIPLRWGDLDAFNHVNNTSMLKLPRRGAGARVLASCGQRDGTDHRGS